MVYAIVEFYKRKIIEILQEDQVMKKLCDDSHFNNLIQDNNDTIYYNNIKVSLYKHYFWIDFWVPNDEKADEIIEKIANIFGVGRVDHIIDGEYLDVITLPIVYNNICLLYTSPSPRDKRQSRMPSSA